MANIMIVGPTQVGKTNTALELMNRHDPNEYSVVWCDTQSNSSGWDCYKLLLEEPCYLDRLDDYDHIIPHDFLRQHRNVYENRKEADLLLDTGAAVRGFRNISEKVLIEEWALAAITLAQYQFPRKKLSELQWAFWFKTNKQLLEDCTYKPARDKFKYLSRNRHLVQQMTDPAKRFLSIFTEPSIAIRDTDGFTMQELLDQGGHLVVEGGKVISQREQRFLLLSRIIEVIRYKQNGGQRKVLLVIEEAEVLNLPPIVFQAIQQTLKFGLHFILICQEPVFNDAEYPCTQVALQNCKPIILRQQSPKVIDLCTKMLASLFQGTSIKEIDFQLRQVQVGWDRYETQSETERDKGGESLTTSFRDVPRYRHDLVPQTKFRTTHEEEQIFKGILTELPIGTAFTVTERGVQRLRFPKVEITVTDEQAEARYREQVQQWPYIQIGENSEPPSNSGSESTQAPYDNSVSDTQNHTRPSVDTSNDLPPENSFDPEDLF